MSPSEGVQYYHHGRFRVQGGIIPDAITAYQTFGDPRNPCVVFPTCYGAKLSGKSCAMNHLRSLSLKNEILPLLDQTYMIGDDRVNT